MSQHRLPSPLLKISKSSPLLKHPWFKVRQGVELYYSERYNTHVTYETVTGQWIFMPYPHHRFRSRKWNKARRHCLLANREIYLKHVRNPCWADSATKNYICSIYNTLSSRE